MSGPAPRALIALSIAEIMARAYRQHLLIPAFNIAYLPMVRPIAETVGRLGSFALVEVARPDIERFEAESYAAVKREYERWADPAHLRLHQDHVPVIDEEGRAVDWRPLIEEALALGYDSVMIDGSRLPLEQNIAATREVVELSRSCGGGTAATAVEGELGAVLGHEPGPLFRSGRGFTDVAEAARFVSETGMDWLSVAVGSVHGAISGAAKDQAKVQARLNIEHLRTISERVAIPLVLHGGTGIELSCVLEAVANGITKINVATALRQPYEACLREGRPLAEAQEAVAQAVERHLHDYGIVGSSQALAGG
jgi:fructose/tagatose bisphosphate aldolase